MRTLILPLFLLAASAGFAAAAIPAPASAAAYPGGNDSGEQGTASGKWDLPGGGLLGHVSGLLADSQGLPAYTLMGVLVPKLTSPAGAMAGELKGSLNQLAGPTTSGFALVHGYWKAGPLGHGHFRAVILDPGDPANGIPPYPIGFMRGKFHDPHGPGTPGLFKAHWKLP